MQSIAIDLETYSAADLTKCGVYRYCSSPTFKILLFGYAVDNETVRVVDLANGETLPAEILEALQNDAVIKWAYNASFERVCLSKYIGLPTGKYLNPKSWRCSMTWGAAAGLPLGLAKIGEQLGLKEQKIKEGCNLIKKFSMPDKEGKKPAWQGKEWEAFKRYNQRDVEVEIAIRDRLQSFPIDSQIWEQYAIDQIINDTGVKVDCDLIEKCISFDVLIHEKIDKELKELTQLENPNSVSQLLNWLKNQGVILKNLGKKEVSEAISSMPHSTAKRVLELRLLSAKSSVKKYAAMARTMCSDSRCRGMFLFYGARTGRWAGRNIQLQNLKRNEIANIKEIREVVKKCDLDSLELLYDDPLEIIGQLVRTAFIAKEDTRFIVADYSAIEARVIAWLAGEEWRMKLFKDGGDIYCASASNMFGVPVIKHGLNGHLRQKGKVAELACGYGGAVGALAAMGALEMGLKEEELQDLVNSWRRANPKIVKFWWDVDAAIRKAIFNPYVRPKVKNLTFKYAGETLYIILPSGRYIAYQKTKIEADGQISYYGTANAFAKVYSYGPKFVENITQAIARDLLANAMKNLKGLRIVMHIHDELVIEAPKEITLDYVCEQMSKTPRWAEDLLLTANGYETKFYMKD